MNTYISNSAVWLILVAQSACSAGDLGSIPGLGRFPWRRKRKPTPVSLPGESHGQRSLAGYSPWGCKESDMTERLTHTEYMVPLCSLVTFPLVLNVCKIFSDMFFSISDIIFCFFFFSLFLAQSLQGLPTNQVLA